MTKKQTITKALKLFNDSTDQYKDEVDDELNKMGYPMVQDLEHKDESYPMKFWEMVIHLVENEDSVAPFVRQLTLDEKRKSYDK